MARYIFSETGRLFRAAVTTTWSDGTTSKSHYGPYTTTGPANSQITRAKRQHADDVERRARYNWRDYNHQISVEGEVEYADVEWTALPAV